MRPTYYSDLDMEIGAFILAAIEKRGLNQARLAELLGRKPSAVSKWINDHNDPSYEDLIKISVATGISLDELLTGKPWVEPLNEAEQQALDFVRANSLTKFQVLKIFSKEVPIEFEG